MAKVDIDAVQKWLEKRWLDIGHDKDKGSMLFNPKHIAASLGISLWEVKTQLRYLRSIGIVGYKFFTDTMNYCNCFNESQNHCECEPVPFGGGYWSWYFNNWHKNKVYEPDN
jgi:hypothetical protein